MTTRNLEKLIKQELSIEGLAQYLDDSQEQYLEFPDGFFAEIVLSDGSKLSDVKSVVKAIQERLQKQGIELDVIVRAIWKVVDVKHSGTATEAVSGIKDVARFAATLQSGGRKCTVIVDVTRYAYEQIRKQLPEEKLIGTDEKSVMAGIVINFLRFELSLGGESFWDPLLYPERELNAGALEYLTTHSPAKAS